MTPPPVPKEALAFFRAKKLRIGFDYRDVWREEHATQFTVAKIVEANILKAIRDSLTTALEQGETFEQWRTKIRPELEKSGWWGKREVVDKSTGEVGVTELGEPRRLRTVFDTNMRTARAAGQWERIQRTKRVLPFLLYSLGPSIEHRPEHVAWHGVLLPADDPWWQSHFAPNGYGCKCNIRQVGRAEYQRLVRDGVNLPGRQELDPDTGLKTGRRERTRALVQTEAPPIDLVPWENRGTGRTENVPRGIDPGFDTNPGAVRQKALAKVLTEQRRLL